MLILLLIDKIRFSIISLMIDIKGKIHKSFLIFLIFGKIKVKTT